MNVHREGFTALSWGDGSANQQRPSIILVHGLRGHPRETWEHVPIATSDDVTDKRRGFRSLFKPHAAPSRSIPPSPGVFWPEQFLVPDIPEAKVWTYGYNADVIGGLFQANNKNSISQHGRDLAVRLVRDVDRDVPIIFVAHSLGGIIVKDALHRSKACCDRTKFIIFLGTPHRGSGSVSWGQIASNLVRLALQDSHKKILQSLEVNSEVLDNIHDEFVNTAYKGQIKIHSFQEARGITGMKGLHEKVVDDFSSKLGLPTALENVESIDANHIQMAKYCNKDEQGYRAILGLLKHFILTELDNWDMLTSGAGDSLPRKLFLVPFSRDDKFIGRKNMIADINKTLRGGALRSHTRLALIGLGGIGKSQIAIEYAYMVRERAPQTHVFWIHASNVNRFEQGYRDIAKGIRLPGWDDPKTDIMQLLYDWLADEKNGRWLMILDNADDDDVFFLPAEEAGGLVQAGELGSRKRPLESFIPQTTNGSVFITSRNLTTAMNLVGTHSRIVQVEPMDEAEALALLKTRVSFDGSFESDALALVRALEYIPLAITHVGAYIQARKPRTNISTCLQFFLESEDNQVSLLNDGDSKDIRQDSSKRHAVIVTWQISFDQIRMTRPAAADLLSLMSMFDRQEIPDCLLRDESNQLAFGNAMASLVAFSLVRPQADKQSFEMHRLVQLSIRKWLGLNNRLKRWRGEALKIMARTFPNGSYETWLDCQTLLPHSKEVLTYMLHEKVDVLNWGVVANNTARYLSGRGQYILAEQIAQGAMEARQSMLGLEHLDTLASVNILAYVLRRRGNYESAETMGRRALEGREKVLGPEHPDTLTSINTLARILCKKGNYESAEAMGRRALEGREKVLGPEHPDTLKSISSLARVLRERGNYEGAEAMGRRALKGREKVLGPEHPETLHSVKVLAQVLKMKDKHEVQKQRQASGRRR